MSYLATCDRFFRDAPGSAFRIAWYLVTLMRDHGHRVFLPCGRAKSVRALLTNSRSSRFLAIARLRRHAVGLSDNTPFATIQRRVVQTTICHIGSR